MIYVDHYRAQFGRMKMSHLMADTSEELRAACDALGLKRSYIQHEGRPDEHLDVSESKRTEAIRKLGAKEVDSRFLVGLIRQRRGIRTPIQQHLSGLQGVPEPVSLAGTSLR